MADEREELKSLGLSNRENRASVYSEYDRHTGKRTNWMRELVEWKSETHAHICHICYTY